MFIEKVELRYTIPSSWDSVVAAIEGLNADFTPFSKEDTHFTSIGSYVFLINADVRRLVASIADLDEGEAQLYVDNQLVYTFSPISDVKQEFVIVGAAKISKTVLSLRIAGGLTEATFFVGETINIYGYLGYYDAEKDAWLDLPNEEVVVYTPWGNEKVITDEHGFYGITYWEGISQTGTYSVNAKYLGSDAYLPSDSEIITIIVVPQTYGILEVHAYQSEKEVVATVSIPNIGTFETPFSKELPTGTYELTAWYMGASKTESVTIEEGVRTTVTFFGEAPSPPSPAGILIAIAASIVLVLLFKK